MSIHTFVNADSEIPVMMGDTALDPWIIEGAAFMVSQPGARPKVLPVHGSIEREDQVLPRYNVTVSHTFVGYTRLCAGVL